MSKIPFIPVCEPHFCGNEEKYVLDAVHSGWVSSAGSYLERFEEDFSSYCGTRYGIATTSGTTALHLALLALGIKPGDEVIIPDFSMAAVLCSVLYCGAKPVFVDAQGDTWNIDPKRIEEKLSEKTKAIIAVHTYGHPVNMDPLCSLASRHGLFVIEDAAEAHGAEYQGKKCGSLGDIACFSFYGNKIITTGEGGMVITSDKQLAENCRYFKNLCFPREGGREYWHKDLGYNYRMTNLQAALGLAQLENLDLLANARRNNAQHYNALLKDIPGLRLPVEKPYAKNVYWMYGVVVEPKTFGLSRNELIEKLREKNVDSRKFFRPLRAQPMLEPFGIRDNGSYPVSDYLGENGLYLPSSSKLTKEQIAYVSETIRLIQSENSANT